MAAITIKKYECDLCGEEYNPDTVAVSEYSPERLTAMRIDGWYKPEKQAIIRCICGECQAKILKVVREIKKSVV